MKQVGIFSVVLSCTFIRKNLCILLVQCREIVIDNARNRQDKVLVEFCCGSAATANC